MTAGVALACLITGLIAGWLLRSAFIRAEISRMLEPMRQEVNYWRRETTRARSIADQLARQLASYTGHLPTDPDWPQEMSTSAGKARPRACRWVTASSCPTDLGFGPTQLDPKAHILLCLSCVIAIRLTSAGRSGTWDNYRGILLRWVGWCTSSQWQLIENPGRCFRAIDGEPPIPIRKPFRGVTDRVQQTPQTREWCLLHTIEHSESDHRKRCEVYSLSADVLAMPCDWWAINYQGCVFPGEHGIDERQTIAADRNAGAGRQSAS